jgi:hypothetical protein
VAAEIPAHGLSCFFSYAEEMVTAAAAEMTASGLSCFFAAAAVETEAAQACLTQATAVAAEITAAADASYQPGSAICGTPIALIIITGNILHIL